MLEQENGFLLLPALKVCVYISIWVRCAPCACDDVQLSGTSHTPAYIHTHKHDVCLCPQTPTQTHKHRDYQTNSIHQGETNRPYGPKAKLSKDGQALKHLSMICSRDTVHGWSAKEG